MRESLVVRETHAVPAYDGVAMTQSQRGPMDSALETAGTVHDCRLAIGRGSKGGTLSTLPCRWGGGNPQSVPRGVISYR